MFMVVQHPVAVATALPAKKNERENETERKRATMFIKYLARKKAEREEQERQALLIQQRMWWEIANAIKGGEPIPFDEEAFR